MATLISARVWGTAEFECLFYQDNQTNWGRSTTNHELWKSLPENC